MKICPKCNTEEPDWAPYCGSCSHKFDANSIPDRYGEHNEIKGGTVEIKGHKLICPICEGQNFWNRQTLMNTRGATFLGFDWANKEADNFICDNCGYVFWFFEK